MIDGHFIVLEGIDGAGTTSVCSAMSKRFADHGLPAYTTCQPSTGPIGAMIRQILSGRVVVSTSTGARSPGWATMAALFAADRLDHLESTVIPVLRDGVTVFCDRYDYSSAAYQSLTSSGSNDAVRWIQDLNRQARRPDLTIVLDVDPRVASKRRSMRPGAPEIYEDDELQTALSSFYDDLENYYPNDNIVHVDSNRNLPVVVEDVARAVDHLRGVK
ncbi:MAG: dTMP kinase [Polyangiales bacterium]